MKLSRTVAYAIHATLQLAGGERGVPIPCSQLANAGKMPERFLLQILRSMVTRGLLCSTRGVDGGYYLARPATEITLRDIVETFDSPAGESLPAFDSLPPDVRKRILVAVESASAAENSELAKLSVADLLRTARNGT